MSDSSKPVGLMVRLPVELHEEIRRFSEGNAARPQASLNATIVFLLRAGLAAVKRAERSEADLGNWVPESPELVEA